jgi:NADPH-dependent 2,4-dienoyl-CoA reductase/sulfur reductase-like enzyme
MVPGLIFGTNVAGDKNEFDPLLWKDDRMNGINEANGTNQKNGSSTNSRFPNRHPNTGIDVLIVGAGMGGLMTALECWRKGHNIVGILERSDGPVYSGIHPLFFVSPYFRAEFFAA